MQEKMRNTFRRLLSIVAAIAMVIGIVGGSTVPAMADTPEYSITVNNTNNRVSINGKTFSAYKVFDLTLGDASATTEGTTKYNAYSYTIKSTDWAYGTLTTDAITDNDGKITTKYGIILSKVSTDGNTITYAIDKGTMTDAEARAFADALTSSLPTNADGSATASEETAVIDVSKSGAGYYAVYGTADPSEKTSDDTELVAALALTTTDKTPTIAPKVDAPTLDKKITGVSDGDTSTSLTDNVLSNGKAATASVGDTVNFELASVVPDLTGYSDYRYTITDTLSEGLDFATSNTDINGVVVKIGDNTLTNTTTPIVGTGTEGDVYVNINARILTIQIPYNSLKMAAKGVAITVTYSATVNNNAVSYNYDKNTASLSYSNDPSDATKTDKTPGKTTYVVNVNINVNKINNSKEKLSGAKFKLYKTVEGENKYYKWTSNKPTWVTEDQADEFITGTDGNLHEVANDGTVGSTTSFKGLDVGTYHLVETEAPSGYDKISGDIPIIIIATLNEDNNTIQVTSTVNGESSDVANGSVGILNTANRNQPEVVAPVVNKTGSLLPSTGGIGATVFYVLGGCLVAAAAIVLIARKKRNA